MNWDDCRYFLAVARTGRLSPAGRYLGVDHTTVARRIRALEDALDAKLYDRSPQGYSLTGAGRDLVPIAENMERNAVLARDAIGGQRERMAGPLRIGVPDGVGAYVISKAAQKLCDLYPELEVQLLAQPRQFSLSNREADFVVAVSRPTTGRLKSAKIANYNLHLYASKAYLAARPHIRSIDDLNKVRGIGYVPEYIFDKQLDYVPLIDPGFKPHLSSTSVHVQLQATVNGAGVAILHDFMAREHKNLVRVLADEVSFTRTFWFVVHEDYAALERIRLSSRVIIDTMRSILKAPDIRA